MKAKLLLPEVNPTFILSFTKSLEKKEKLAIRENKL